MFASQIESQASLHGGQQFNMRLLGQHLLDQSKIREVIFDVENSSTVGSGPIVGRDLESLWQGLQWRFSRWQVDPKGRPLADNTVNPDVSAHGIHQTLAKRET